MGLFNVSQKDATGPSQDMAYGSKSSQPYKKDLQLDLAEKYQNKALVTERLLRLAQFMLAKTNESLIQNIFFEKRG